MKLIVDTKLIKRRILDLDKNQSSIANDLGVSRVHLNNLINGKSQSTTLAMRLSRLLGGRFEDYFKIDMHDDNTHRKSC